MENFSTSEKSPSPDARAMDAPSPASPLAELAAALKTAPLPPRSEARGKILYTRHLLEYLTLNNRMREIREDEPEIGLALDALRERLPNLAEALGIA